MDNTLMLMAAVAIFAALWLALLVLAEQCVRLYRRSPAPRVIRCPKSHAPAALELASGSPLRVDRCSRWSEQPRCQQECVAAIGAAQLHREVRHVGPVHRLDWSAYESPSQHAHRSLA